MRLTKNCSLQTAQAGSLTDKGGWSLYMLESREVRNLSGETAPSTIGKGRL